MSTSSAGDHAWRRENIITCIPPLVPIYDFAELRDVFPTAVMGWIQNNGYQNPTLVKSQTLGGRLARKGRHHYLTYGIGKDIGLFVASDSSFGGKRAKVPGVGFGTYERILALQVENIAKSFFRNLPHNALATTGGNIWDGTNFLRPLSRTNRIW